MTLACEDGQQIEAHKVVLSSSSPFFGKLLNKNKHPHPLVFMRGFKFEDLSAVVDFLYVGEANVYQENLDSFLAIAEELRLKGLMGQVENVEKKTNNTYTDSTFGQINSKPIYKKEKSNTERMGTVLCTLVETLRCLAIILQPLMPSSSNEMLNQLNVPMDERLFTYLTPVAKIKAGVTIEKPSPIFIYLT